MNCLIFSNMEAQIRSDTQSDNESNNLVNPKSSGYTITEKWNYTASNIPRLLPQSLPLARHYHPLTLSACQKHPYGVSPLCFFVSPYGGFNIIIA